MPKISIITPCHNYARFLTDLIQSVLAQTHTDWELFICDDGSTDSPEEIVCTFNDERIRFIPGHASGGPSAPRNRGLEAASGEYIAFLDADDMLLPDSLETRLRLISREGVDFISTQAIDVDVGCSYEEMLTLPRQSNRFSCYRMPTVMCKREKIQRFNENLLRHEETELFIRMSSSTSMACFPHVTAAYHLNPMGIVSGLKAMSEEERKLHYTKFMDVVGVYDPKIKQSGYRKASLVGANIQKATKIGGWMSTDELRFLAALASRSKVVVEVGVYKGRSTMALAANTDGVVYSIDPWDFGVIAEDGSLSFTVGDKVYRKFCKNLGKYIDSGTVIPVRSRFTNWTSPLKVDAIFIDGDHLYPSVIEDIKHAMRIGPRILAGHDYGTVDWPGVKRAVDELIPDVQVMQSIWWKELV